MGLGDAKWPKLRSKVKGQRSYEIWQSLKKDVNAHGFVIVIRRKLVFGRMAGV